MRLLVNHMKGKIYILPFASNRSAQTFYALFSAQNVHVWQAKHARLAGETCTFGRRNMHVWQAKHVRLAGDTCTFGRRNMHVWQAKHALLKV